MFRLVDSFHQLQTIVYPLEHPNQWCALLFSEGLGRKSYTASMKTAIHTLGTSIMGLAFLACTSGTPLFAHQLTGVNGKYPTHEHVYKRSGIGKNFTTGHYARPAGSHGIVIWSPAPAQAFGKALPGLIIPRGHVRQPSIKQLFQQQPALSPPKRIMPNSGR